MESSKSERIVIPIIVAVLLIGGWGFGISQFSWKKPSDPQPLPARQMTQTSSPMRGATRGTAVAIAPFVPSDPNWREKFDKVYTLADEENVKFVAPPFIPERETIFRVDRGTSAGQVLVPNTMILRYENGRAMTHTTLPTGARLPIQTLIQLIATVPANQLELPANMTTSDSPGDWIFRSSATPAQRMTGLGVALSKATGKTYRFEQQSVDRDVVSVSGTYAFKPLEGSTAPGVQIYVDTPDTNSPMRSSTMQTLLANLSSYTGAQFVPPPVTAGPTQVVQFSFHNSLMQARSQGPLNAEQLDKLLQLLSSQTGMEFKKEKRKMDVWKLIEG